MGSRWRVIEAVALPMLTLLFLIGKKKPTESRTVANSPTFYHILMALLKDALHQWDKAFAEPEDTAAPGKRADDEEVARYRKQCAAIISWDAKQYFDRLNRSSRKSKPYGSSDRDTWHINKYRDQ